MTRHRSLLLVAVTAFLLGCKDDPVSTGPTVDTPMSYVEYMHYVNLYTCHMRFLCCGATQAAQLDPGKSTESACAQALDARVPALYRSLLAAITNGDARFDLIKSAICLDSLKNGRLACDDPDTYNPASDACTSVVVGTGPIGGGCTAATICPLGTYCAPGDTDAGTGGQCLAAGDKGVACGAGQAPCDTYLVCGPDGKCALPIDTGGACTAAEQCLSRACTNGACAAPPTVRAVYCNP